MRGWQTSAPNLHEHAQFGMLPKDWEVAPLWAVTTCNDEVLAEGTDPEWEMAYVEISGVTAGMGIVEATVVRFAEAPSRARRRVRAGDVLVSTVRTYLRAIAPVVDPPENLVVSTGFAVLRPHAIAPRFLGYAVQAEFFIAEVIGRSVGVSYPAINAGDLVKIKVPFPPLPDQAAIATFLDRETAKIDALVEEQKRLIDLLKGKRQAIISHAVTKGLNPNAPMKETGIEWLGQVPEHWEVLMLRRCLDEVDYGISDSLEPDGSIAVLRMGNIQDGAIDTCDLKYVDNVEARLLLAPGDLLYNRTNSLDLIGKVGLFVESDGPTTFASYLVRLRTVAECAPQFMAYLLNTAGVLGTARSRAFVAIGQCNLNPTRYGEIVVARPPLCEQHAINQFLDREVSTANALLIEAEKAVGLLLERRSALISAAVTGKIDIRGMLEETEVAA